MASKVSDENHDAGELVKTAPENDPPPMAHKRASPVAKLAEEPPDHPAMPVATQHPPILHRYSFAIASERADQLAVQTHHQASKPIGIIGTTSDEPQRKTSGPLLAIRQSLNHQRHLSGRWRGKGASHRKTLPPSTLFICLLGLSDA